MIGQTLGHYEITELLGRGGMGEVWKARDRKLDRDVAIKTLPKEFGEDPLRLARFEREAKVLASLNHPNIGGIYGLEESEGTRFLVLEFVEGEVLADRLAEGPLPIEDCLRLGLQLVEALESAHAKGVVHRDLKPANIKVTPDGKVKVLDFGLAKALAGDTAAALENAATVSIAPTLEGSIIGTPGYMSPEQARGEPTDKRTDVWSFGCVLFEMLTGHVTFGGRTLTDALAGVIARDPEWSRLPANVHPRLRLLLERCLEKDPHNRYHDIAEARVDLEAVMTDPAGMYATGATYSARKRLAAVPWALAALALAVALVLWLMAPVPSAEVTRFVASVYPSPAVDLPGDLVTVAAVAMSPDGRRIAYPVLVDNELTIYIRETDRLEGRRLRPTGMAVAPFFSPDGAALGFVDPTDRTIKRAALDQSDSPLTVFTYPEDTFPIGASWGPDETIVFALFGDEAGLLSIQARGGQVTELTTPEDGEEHYWPDVLPDGRGVLFAVGSTTGESRIAILDLATREIRTLIDSGTEPRYLGDDVLVYNDSGALQAVRFDSGSLRVEGDPVTVIENVAWQPSTGATQYAVSRTGDLVWVNGRPITDPALRTLALGDRAGRLEPLELRPAAYAHPRVAPDGAQIAVQSFDNNDRGIIWIYDVERRTQRQLTTEGSNVRPIWTPDGERITFASNRDEGTWGIYWQRADGSDVAEKLTTAEPGMQHYPDSWHPDGNRLAFTNINPENTAQQSIWILDLAAGSETVLKEPISGGLAFSSNGRWMAYRLTRADVVNQLYVEPFPPTGAVYQITQEFGSSPVWSPDGTRLVYRRAIVQQQNQRSPLVARDVTTGETFTFGNEQFLPIRGFMTFFGYRDYDFMPDSDRLVMVFPAGQDLVSERFVPRVNVVLNWIEELRVPVAAR